ncbi:hydrogenase maturation protein HypF [Sulfurimonas gotlandica GD1]|uniref:Carbamoyltransferase n=1 Tax=Sulfurimonas gotlandica (strain DSM 19862 / JCM 16533 / GD1) TaxID=929558 RepID=B6BMW1_SULGG|nr:carbamoyltransferase HypF [Sulfurimonas gotlandica]EDZ61578.1 (NiFe) hydrogenase maturation protein HypF [Sulfurimonas gotlandica GD1]EHP30767.1 hydrogenase maturation protein HypF [Sulfurimonas gotlandica GD1]
MSYFTTKRFGFKIFGQVQGVGFRPFIYKIATELNINGFVKNSEKGVDLELEGEILQIEEFMNVLNSDRLPPLARIDKIQQIEIKPLYREQFEIIHSTLSVNNGSKVALVIPDTAICEECLFDTDSPYKLKYYDYFATTCTNCGPRYSIIQTVPYDRENTSMSKFKMCTSCEEEYTNPLNRRYHAQPISCNDCGPTLTDTIEKTAEFIKNGKIVAMKGLGGFHIVCDATNDEVIERLRVHKNRPTKPLAIMCKDLEQVKLLASASTKEQELLASKEAPIVILNKALDAKIKISDKVAPNIDRIGCFLPYTALHHLLFKQLKNPIVATSANLGSEPIIIKAEDIKEKLPFVDFVLDFDRDIVNGVDDSLVQVVNGNTQMLRLSRGFAPKVIKLGFKSEKKILAVGANAKNAIAFVIEDNIILSPHIGDLGSLKAFEFFERTIETFKSFYDFEPDVIVHDMHPNYETTKWAKAQGKELVEVQHHLAHIYACKAEFELSGDYLGFSFDGTGYGSDGQLWGGEIFVGDVRKYSFKSLKLLGGEKAIKEPRRVALSMLFDKYSLDEVLSLDAEVVKSFKESEIKILHQSHTKNLNAPLSSSVGRLFDAMASFSNLLQFQSYEGEAGLICEENYKQDVTQTLEYKIVDGIIDIEFDFFDKNIVSKFINTLAQIVLDISKIEKMEVILSGGVFQNKTLLELAASKLKDADIKYFYQSETAINDGGIALGQAYFEVMNHKES